MLVGDNFIFKEGKGFITPSEYLNNNYDNIVEVNGYITDKWKDYYIQLMQNNSIKKSSFWNLYNTNFVKQGNLFKILNTLDRRRFRDKLLYIYGDAGTGKSTFLLFLMQLFKETKKVQFKEVLNEPLNTFNNTIPKEKTELKHYKIYGKIFPKYLYTMDAEFKNITQDTLKSLSSHVDEIQIGVPSKNTSITGEYKPNYIIAGNYIPLEDKIFIDKLEIVKFEVIHRGTKHENYNMLQKYIDETTDFLNLYIAYLAYYNKIYKI